MNNYLFHVSGIHCKSCAILIEQELQTFPGVSQVRVDLETHSLNLTGDFEAQAPEQLAAEFSRILSSRGYGFSVEKRARKINWADFKTALPLALAFIAAFILLQKIGIVNLISVDRISYQTAFVVGIIASLSTCMAVVGGLVLSLSATFVAHGDRVKPQLIFHLGRLAAFFLLGGAIGALGAVFSLNDKMMFGLTFVIGVVMLLLGINLLDILHWSKKLQPTMPKFFARHALGLSKINHRLTPLLAGIATFFLPCGFTQSMQIYTLSVGNFWQGAFLMSAFALGTLPVLALLSFSSFSVEKSGKRGIFYKTVGLVVIVFALFNLINSLAVIGLISPIFNF